MDMSQVFPSKYLKAEDLGDQIVKVVIESTSMDDLAAEGKPPEIKPVVRLRGHSKGWVLNRTNNGALMKYFGKDSEAWAGKEVELFSVPVSVNGEAKHGIRCKLPADPDVVADVQF